MVHSKSSARGLNFCIVPPTTVQHHKCLLDVMIHWISWNSRRKPDYYFGGFSKISKNPDQKHQYFIKLSKNNNMEDGDCRRHFTTCNIQRASPGVQVSTFIFFYRGNWLGIFELSTIKLFWSEIEAEFQQKKLKITFFLILFYIVNTFKIPWTHDLLFNQTVTCMH